MMGNKYSIHILPFCLLLLCEEEFFGMDPLLVDKKDLTIVWFV